MSALTEGQPAPDFEAQSTAGTLRQKDTSGHKLVIYFYPRDNTPGCTTETADFRDHWQSFRDTDCYVVGVSRDSMSSHKKFSDKLELPFPLIADPDETLCNLFEVMRDKNMYGKVVRGIERSTFLIDRKGNLARIWRGVKVPGHAEAVLEAARELD